MIYVFDSGPLIVMFRHFYPKQFPSLWINFDNMVAENRATAVREVLNELTGYSDNLSEWAKAHKSFFPKPTSDELRFVTEIFKIKHFQTLIRKKERLQGTPVADPFVIAKAKVLHGCVVTMEKLKANAAKIPNVCERFDIPCMNLEKFMEKENWRF